METLRRTGILAATLVLAALAGCAATNQAHGPVIVGRSAAALPSGYEQYTLYNCTSGTGTQVVFTQPKFFVQVMSRGGNSWVKQHGPIDTPSGVVNNPVPSANAIASGWNKLRDGDLVSFGQDPGNTANEAVPVSATVTAGQTAFLDVWCDGGSSDVIVLAH